MKKGEKVLEILAQHLGADKEDIDVSDSFTDDLRMNAIELTDFAQALEVLDCQVTSENISEFETVGELLEFVDQESEL